LDLLSVNLFGGGKDVVTANSEFGEVTTVVSFGGQGLDAFGTLARFVGHVLVQQRASVGTGRLASSIVLGSLDGDFDLSIFVEVNTNGLAVSEAREFVTVLLGEVVRLAGHGDTIALHNE